MRSPKPPAPKRRKIKNEYHLNNAILKDRRENDGQYIKKQLIKANQ